MLLASSQPPPIPDPNQTYHFVSTSKPPKPAQIYSWKTTGHSKKTLAKKKDGGGSYPLYKSPHDYNAYLNPPGPIKPSSSKGKTKALSTQSSSFSSASGLGWDDPDGLAVMPLENSSAENLPKDEFDDDIDIATPDVVEEEDGVEEQEFLDTPESSGENHIDGVDEEDESTDATPIPHSKMNGGLLPMLDFDYSPIKGKGKGKAREIDESPSKDKGKGKAVDRGTPSPVTKVKPDETTEEPVSSEEVIQEYVRLHHGIPLEKLSIYLIPVKPSTLFRAIDFSALKSITLLNVGPQRALWAALAKLQKWYPLQLKSIYVDNVTPSFLVFLNGHSCHFMDPKKDIFQLQLSKPILLRVVVINQELYLLCRHSWPSGNHLFCRRNH